MGKLITNIYKLPFSTAITGGSVCNIIKVNAKIISIQKHHKPCNLRWQFFDGQGVPIPERSTAAQRLKGSGQSLMDFQWPSVPASSVLQRKQSDWYSIFGNLQVDRHDGPWPMAILLFDEAPQ